MKSILVATVSTVSFTFALAPATAAASFVDQVKDHVVKHEWDKVLDLADPGHRDQQMRVMGISKAQYIAELFGLNSVGNTVASPPPILGKHLNKIIKIEWKTQPTGEFESIHVEGIATLDDGTKLKVQIEIIKTDQGYRLTGAVG